MSLRALSLLLVLCLAAPAGAKTAWTPTGAPKKVRRVANAKVQEVDVLVIGAGVAGLTAAKTMKQSGRSYALVEASDRIGGRVFTNAEGHDMGAAWNHNALNNRLGTEVYGPLGAKMVESPLADYLFVSDKPSSHARAATESETESFRKAKERVEAYARRTLKNGKDISAGTLSRLGGKWAQLIADELGELDAGVNLDRGVSGADIFGFGGGGDKDRMIEGGLGHFYTTKFAKGIDARLNSPVVSIDHTDPKRTIVKTANGLTYSARKVIATMSTGVLAKGDIDVKPAWPEWKLNTLDHLKMGVFNKIVLDFKATDFMRYHDEPIQDSAWVMNQVEGKEDWAFVMRPLGKDAAVAFVGGELGKRIERMGDDRATKLALKNMKRIFGDDVKRQFMGSTVTRWGNNPFTEGSYAYSAVRDLRTPFAEGEPVSPKEAKIGKKLEWHEMLAQPVADENGVNRIYFAGEAVGMGNRRLNHLYQTSVAGAYVSAKVASEKILAELKSEDRAEKSARRAAAKAEAAQAD